MLSEKPFQRAFEIPDLELILNGVFDETLYCYTGAYAGEREDLKKEERFLRLFPNYNGISFTMITIYLS